MIYIYIIITIYHIYMYNYLYEIGYNHWLTTIYGTFTYHHNIISLKTSSPPVHCTVFLMKVVTVLCQLWSSRHLCVDRPKQPLTHLPRSRQRPLSVAWICRTFLSWSWTAEQSPPQSALPQATSEPSDRIAANALSVAWICCTFLGWSWTAEQSPP